MGYRHGHPERQLIGTFGTETPSVPRARAVDENGKATEWRSKALPRYPRLTGKAEALIASVCLGALGFGPDSDAKDRRLGNPGSAHRPSQP